MGLVYRLLQECWQQKGYVFLPQKLEGGKFWSEGTGKPWPSDGDLNISMARDQYFSPLVFSRDRRRKEAALPTHVLWADLDEADPAQCALRPSAAWQTTQGGFLGAGLPDDAGDTSDIEKRLGEQKRPHWQALWFLHKPPESPAPGLPPGMTTKSYGHFIPAEQAAQLSRRIAYAEGADKSGWDITQVLRLPGTFNHKHTPPQKIDLLWAERRYYTVAQVEAAYPSVPEPQVTEAVSIGDIAERIRAADKVLETLPVGLQMALERESGGDRSLEILKLATELVRFNVPTDVALVLLKRSPLVRDKFAHRRDIDKRLLDALGSALLSVHANNRQGRSEYRSGS